MFCPPPIGASVLVITDDTQAESGSILGVFFNDVDRPLKVPAGEFWLVHQSGAFLKFTDDGRISLNSAVGIGLTGPTKITGTLEVTQAVTADAGVAVTGGLTTDTFTSTGATKLGGTGGNPVNTTGGAAVNVKAT